MSSFDCPNLFKKLNLYFSEIGLYDSYFALIWVYQLITLPLLLWIVRGYFEDISPDIEYAYRLDGHSWFQSFWKISIPLAKPGIAAASLLCFIYAWNNFVFALILGSSQIQPVTVGALAFITASAIPYGLIACGIVVSVLPTLILLFGSGQFGFLSYEQDEGKKLFFHMSEVESGEILQVGDEVEFVVVTNQRTRKHSACCVRKLW